MLHKFHVRQIKNSKAVVVAADGTAVVCLIQQCMMISN